MANVGWVGLGKLGAPCAAALQNYGNHVVHGYDVRGTNPGDYDWAGEASVTLELTIGDVVKATDRVVFVAVQTPHAPRYGGETPMPEERREFEYGYLVNAVREVAAEALAQRKRVTIAVVSTVLPGTFNRYLRALANDYVSFVYHPFFIAMGTVVDDFVSPEMVLFGADDETETTVVADLYYMIHDAPGAVMSIESAELAKVAYNTFITMKIVFANHLMEVCEGTGADVDEVTDALAKATHRVVSARYLRAGMGDGGACHPRDNVALAAIGERLGVSADLNGFLVCAREAQTDWLAAIVERWRSQTGLPVVLLGTAYKPGVALTDGSPALLLRDLLERRGVSALTYDPLFSDTKPVSEKLAIYGPCVYVVSTRHPQFSTCEFPAGSVVIDPFGYVPSRPGVVLVTPGRKR